MTKLISGVTTNVILMPGSSIWLAGTADLLENEFGRAFPETFLFGFLPLYEAVPITKN